MLLTRIKKIGLIILLSASGIILFSCKTKFANYNVDAIDSTQCLQLKNWNILGLIKTPDTLGNSFLEKDHLISSGISEKEFCKKPYDLKIHVPLDYKVAKCFFNDFYESHESIINFDEIHNVKEIKQEDVKGSAIYYYCKIKSSQDKELYMLTGASNGIKVWLNGRLIYTSDEKRNFERGYSDFFQMKLNRGVNHLFVKKINLSNDIFFESMLCNKIKAIEKYHQNNANMILNYPIADSKLKLRDNYSKIFDTVIKYSIKDFNNKCLFSQLLNRDSSIFLPIKFLQRNHAYICSFLISGFNFSQPFFVGSPDSALSLFIKKRESYLQQKKTIQQIDAYLFRLRYLLNHSSRTNDWWWSYKTSNILYELDNIFTSLDAKKEISANTFGIQIKSYTSRLDNNIQYYLLITPDSIKKSELLPLVLVIRPFIENNHHFLASPQIARYWSLNNAKYLANKYRYAILMPEGRLYLNEQFIPMAEAEILQAIEKVQEEYNIDKDRIYLHGNCSAGNRCLIMACHHPDMFAAIGLYAPVYHSSSSVDWVIRNSPEEMIKNLTNTPIKIHYDPDDIHSPYSFFKDLIDDCKKNNIVIDLSSSRLSGMYYNVMLVGDEVFSFFKNKKKLNNPSKINYSFYSGQSDSVWWLECKPHKKSEKVEVFAEYLNSTISIKGRNISEIYLNLNYLGINGKKLKVEFNGKSIFNQICDKKPLHFSLNHVKEKHDYLADDETIADLFAKPFLFVMDSLNKSKQYLKVTDSLKIEYESSFFSKFPVIDGNNLTKCDLNNKNLFFIGTNFKNKLLINMFSKLPVHVTSKNVQVGDKISNGNTIEFQSVFINPLNSNRLIVIYSTNNPEIFKHHINYPWKNSLVNVAFSPIN
jgi:hypothetical protein